MNEENLTTSEPDDLQRRLKELRDALLQLHKALMDSERTSYEQTFGKIASPYQFLKLLTEDPWFAWLRPVSQLIAAIDEALDAKEPLTSKGVEDLIVRARKLLVPTEEGEGFSKHYDEALQRDPDVVFGHAIVAKLFGPKPAKCIELKNWQPFMNGRLTPRNFPHILSGSRSSVIRWRPRLFSCLSFAI